MARKPLWLQEKDPENLGSLVKNTNCYLQFLNLLAAIQALPSSHERFDAVCEEYVQRENHTVLVVSLLRLFGRCQTRMGFFQFFTQLYSLFQQPCYVKKMYFVLARGFLNSRSSLFHIQYQKYHFFVIVSVPIDDVSNEEQSRSRNFEWSLLSSEIVRLEREVVLHTSYVLGTCTRDFTKTWSHHETSWARVGSQKTACATQCSVHFDTIRSVFRVAWLRRAWIYGAEW